MLQKRTSQVFADHPAIFSMRESLLKHIQCLLQDVQTEKIIVTGFRRVYGGDINTTLIIHTNIGNWFLKQNDREGIDRFEKEYNALKFLDTKCVLKVPAPVVSGVFEGDSFLIMEYLEKENPTRKSWQNLGAGLAALHRQTQLQYGFSEDNYIGNLPQPNPLTDSWSDFYTSQRILPLLQKALQKQLCSTKDILMAELVCQKLSSLFPDEPPSLIHGDLWSGNMMACNNAKAAIYDPAVYYGHREMDIAMTLLFGGFDHLFYDSYNDAYPLQSGWQQRVELCQLYPLLVHLNLFGDGYYERVRSILDNYK